LECPDLFEPEISPEVPGCCDGQYLSLKDDVTASSPEHTQATILDKTQGLLNTEGYDCYFRKASAPSDE